MSEHMLYTRQQLKFMREKGVPYIRLRASWSSRKPYKGWSYLATFPGVPGVGRIYQDDMGYWVYKRTYEGVVDYIAPWVIGRAESIMAIEASLYARLEHEKRKKDEEKGD